MNFSKEMIEKAKTASSAAELLEMAKAAGVELTAEDAEMYFNFLANGTEQLSDEELLNVAGGKGRPEPKYSAGRRVVFWDSRGVGHYGTIVDSWWVDLQNAYYYLVQMDEGGQMKFGLESPACAAKVI